MTSRPPFKVRARAQPIWIPGATEATALETEAGQNWSAATGMAIHAWLGPADPHVTPLVESVRAALAAGASVTQYGIWCVVVAPDGARLVVAEAVLVDAMER